MASSTTDTVGWRPHPFRRPPVNKFNRSTVVLADDRPRDKPIVIEWPDSKRVVYEDWQH